MQGKVLMQYAPEALLWQFLSKQLPPILARLRTSYHAGPNSARPVGRSVIGTCGAAAGATGELPAVGAYTGVSSSKVFAGGCGLRGGLYIESCGFAGYAGWVFGDAAGEMP
jgi:hypothetical protein